MATISYPRKEIEARLDPKVSSNQSFDVHLIFTTPAYSTQVHLTISFDDYKAQRAYYKDYRDGGVIFVCSIKDKEIRIPEQQMNDWGPAIGPAETDIQSKVIVKYCYNEKPNFEKR